MSNELWKPIEGYNGLYAISNKGRIESLERRITKVGVSGTRLIKQKFLNPCGFPYLKVSLYKEGKRRCYTLASLVARAFVPNPNDYSDVSYRNADTKDCKASNLIWTPKGRKKSNKP